MDAPFLAFDLGQAYPYIKLYVFQEVAAAIETIL